MSGPSDIWRRTPVEEIEADARMVVGPGEPYGSHSQADVEADHWAGLAGIGFAAEPSPVLHRMGLIPAPAQDYLRRTWPRHPAPGQAPSPDPSQEQ